MVKLDDLDTSFLVPCKRCAELLQEHERVCPFCGKDQATGDEPPQLPAGQSSVDGSAAPLPTSAMSSRPAGAPRALSGDGLADAGFDRPHREGQTGPPVRRSRRVLGAVAVLGLLLGLVLAVDPLGWRAPRDAERPPAARDVVRQVEAPPATPALATAAEPEAPATPPVPEACGEALRALSLCTSP